MFNQHGPVSMNSLVTSREGRHKIEERKIKAWKLKNTEIKENFQRKMNMAGSIEGDWTKFRDYVLKAAKEVCGETRGAGGVRNRETWWRSNNVQSPVKEKRIAFKRWQRSRREEDKRIYVERKMEAKRQVTAAKTAEWEQWSRDLETNEGRLKMFKVAKQMRKERKDVIGVKFIKGDDGEIETKDKDILRRWQEYFEQLLNEENDWQAEREEVT